MAYSLFLANFQIPLSTLYSVSMEAIILGEISILDSILLMVICLYLLL